MQLIAQNKYGTILLCQYGARTNGNICSRSLIFDILRLKVLRNVLELISLIEIINCYSILS
ncbi:hypothetical protein V1477_020488 [Vespula maculifrons]|uniref:Uncharacterized protein n=1 Tax=Vespula maculifrons TaxID=7453 RepID=A0ABD2AM21_VESMC